MAAKIKKGDTVIVITGKDKGRKGEVLTAFPEESRVLVSGVNIKARHTKPSQADPTTLTFVATTAASWMT